MLASLKSMALIGIEAVTCDVEVDVSGRGFKGPTIVGLPDAAVKESVHRIKTALSNCGYAFPRSSSVINLAPADLKKEGPAFDLPIALGLIFADAQSQARSLRDSMIVGELALDGQVRSIKGALSAGLLASECGLKQIVVPRDNAQEVAVVEGIDVMPVSTLTEAVGLLSETLPIEPASVDIASLLQKEGTYTVDFSDVRGQEHAKRALTIAAAGGHNILLIGPPGSGKTMLSRRLPTIMPPMSLAEALETTRVYSASGKLARSSSLIGRRPVRAPHHTSSAAALIGGGTVPKAGEVSLANFGVLFLDELPEFSRQILETLRQPLEEGQVTISRAYGSVCFPAHFVLVAAMNPCPCGYYTDPSKPCKCATKQIEKYVSRLSGPLIDRIDIHVEVPVVAYKELRSSRDGTSSSVMAAQVSAARERQRARFDGEPTALNGNMSTRESRKHCVLDQESEALLKQAMTELGLSARAHDKVLRLSRTIADLDDSAQVQVEHVTEAILYRRLDRQL